MFVTLSKEVFLHLVLKVALALSPGQCVSADLWGFQAGAPLNLPKDQTTGNPLLVVWEEKDVPSLTGGVVPVQPVFGAMQLPGFKRPFVCAGPDQPHPHLMIHEVGHLKEFIEGGDEAILGKFSWGTPNSKHLKSEKYADNYLFSTLALMGYTAEACGEFLRGIKELPHRPPGLAEAAPSIAGYPRDSERLASCKAVLTR